MKLKLAIIAQGVSLEQIQALLQAFRDWEQAAKRAEADVQVHFFTEPQISTQEARALLQRLSPPLKKMVEVPRPGMKLTPESCKFWACKYNTIPPREGSQECIGCEGLKPLKKPKAGV